MWKLAFRLVTVQSGDAEEVYFWYVLTKSPSFMGDALMCDTRNGLCLLPLTPQENNSGSLGLQTNLGILQIPLELPLFLNYILSFILSIWVFSWLLRAVSYISLMTLRSILGKFLNILCFSFFIWITETIITEPTLWAFVDLKGFHSAWPTVSFQQMVVTPYTLSLYLETEWCWLFLIFQFLFLESFT